MVRAPFDRAGEPVVRTSINIDTFIFVMKQDEHFNDSPYYTLIVSYVRNFTLHSYHIEFTAEKYFHVSHQIHVMHKHWNLKCINNLHFDLLIIRSTSIQQLVILLHLSLVKKIQFTFNHLSLASFPLDFTGFAVFSSPFTRIIAAGTFSIFMPSS